MLDGPSQVAAGVREGDVIAGKYRVDKVLGVGGMGVVVAAHHMQLDTKVALKFLLGEALRDSEAVGRFAREARAAVRIKSEHVARVIDVGTLENGSPYMVMEYLEGGDLAGWLRQRGALPIEQAVEFVLQAGVAVADAHALGIVHRDIKPANLFCVRRSDGQLSIKVLDFGISKITSPTGAAALAQMTKTNALMGSPLYMSPEQMRSTKGVDSRTDIWALGVVLFELVAGRPPFLSDSLMELGIKIATEAPPPVRAFRPDVPPGLEAAIVRCLEKDPGRRYSNVGELALALLPVAPKRAKASVERISGIIQSAGLSASALAVPSSPRPESSPESRGESAGSTLPPVGRTMGEAPRKRKTGLVGVGVLGALAVVAGVTLALVSKRGHARADDPLAAAGQATDVAEGKTAATVAVATTAVAAATMAAAPPLPETNAADASIAGATPSRQRADATAVAATPTPNPSSESTAPGPRRTAQTSSTTSAKSAPPTMVHPAHEPRPRVEPGAAGDDDPLSKLQPKK
jgi:serine/threonine protein kinase